MRENPDPPTLVSEPEFPIMPLSALEISGAVSARVIHELSNLLSGIVGNAEYAGVTANDPAGLRKAIQAISVSANSAGRLLGQCLPLQRAISGETFPYDVSEQAYRIAEAAGLAPGWRAKVPEDLAGQVKVHPRWLAASVWQLARETQVARGEVDFAAGPGVFPVVWNGAKPNPGVPLRVFRITLQYRAEEPLVSGNAALTPERPGLLAALELIQRFRGQIHYQPKPPGRQEICVLIPLL
jgi:hypothetical protein